MSGGLYAYEWALAVSRAYRDSVTPLLILAHEENSLVGVVALATDKAQRETFFLAGMTADFCDFVSPPQLRQELVMCVLAELRKLGLPMWCWRTYHLIPRPPVRWGRRLTPEGITCFVSPHSSALRSY